MEDISASKAFGAYVTLKRDIKIMASSMAIEMFFATKRVCATGKLGRELGKMQRLRQLSWIGYLPCPCA